MTHGQEEPAQLNKAPDWGQPLHHTRAIVRWATPCCDGIAGVDESSLYTEDPAGHTVTRSL